MDWDLVAKIAGGGFGLTILVLAILALIAWVVGLIIQRARKGRDETSTEGKK